MKRRISSLSSVSGGKHSFLFWLALPIILIWLSIGYLTGVVFDKPSWFKGKVISGETSPVVAHLEDYNNVLQDLDKPFITFWFDDAWLSQYLVGYPILKENGFVGVMAVPIDAIETKNYMNWAQLRLLQNAGWEITNHSLAHDCTMDKWEKDRVAFEYQTSRLMLWKNKLASDIFVTPCGVDSETMRTEAQKTFLGYRTVNPGFNEPKNIDFYDLKVKNIDDQTNFEEIKSWIDEAKRSNYWVILVFHKIGEKSFEVGDDKFNTKKEDFENVVGYVKSSNIQVVVPRQILSSQTI